MSQRPHHTYRVVLSRPRFPRNIGACARVCANFDVRDLRVVAPEQPDWRQDEEARKLAVAHAREDFEAIRVEPDLSSALKGCVAAIGFTRRMGKDRKTLPFARLETLKAPPAGEIALVFGNEETGLSEAELLLCSDGAHIPSSDRLGSLNLSHAVAVILSRLFEHDLEASYSPATDGPPPQWATIDELEGLFEHWRGTAVSVGLDQAGNPERITRRIRSILLRADLLKKEVKLLRGFLAKVQNRVRRTPPS